jgi:cytochrome oxidase Cu insertion factor (SCO1/SenC/PrrC family)
MIKRACLILCLIYFSLPLPNILAEPGAKASEQASNSQSTAHVHEHETVRPEKADPGSENQRIGVDEKLGHIVPLNLTFSDEDNKPVNLKDFIQKPTLLLPIFYYCPQVCSIMLANLATALNDVTFIPGDDYRVLALSFNDEEGPEIARDAKTNYLKILDKSFPEAEWKFLTGKPENIVEKITEGKLQKFYKENCLLNQAYVRDPDLTIQDVLNGLIGKIGENITIKRFCRFQIGTS